MPSPTDLVTWDERPVAIRQYVDADGRPVEYVFSGSAVQDGDDLVAVYTSVRFPTSPDAPGLQTQHLARSTDGGETWTKDPANPVLDRGSTDFRDPKVFRDGDRWLMAAVEAVRAAGRLLRERRPVRVDAAQRVRRPEVRRAVGVPRPVPAGRRGDGRGPVGPAGQRATGAPGGGSGMRWWVGDFDGTDFTPEDSGWLDHGRDCYAAVT